MIAVCVLLASCKKILEPTPTDFMVASTFYKKKANLNAALAGVYAALGSNSLYAETYQCHITSGVEEAVMFQSSTAVPKIGYYNATVADNEAARLWANLYAGIDRANQVLENIDAPEDITEDEKQIIRGETVFLRAYYYFLLTQWFGDIPLRNHSSAGAADAHLAFTPTREVYDFIISEMETAAGLLSEQTADKASSFERITVTAVQAILARVCLYAAGEPVNDKDRYQDAARWARLVVNSGVHRLHPDYREVFRLQLRDQYDLTYRESMWEVGFHHNPTAPETNAGKHIRVGIQSTNDIVGRCDGWIVVHPRALRMYASNNLVAVTGTSRNIARDTTPDVRRDWNIAKFKYSGGSATQAPNRNIQAYQNYWGRYPGKWRREEELPPHDVRSPANIPIIRYADVLLMLAEAENEINGPTAEAVDLVNQIRKRAYQEDQFGQMLDSIQLTSGGSGYTSIPKVTITGGGATENATARASISGGRVTGVYLSGLGYGYSSLPEITITGVGTGAVAEAVHISDSRLLPSQYASPEAFRKTIQDERLRELLGEFLRRQDLKRWGLLESTVKLMANDAENGDNVLQIVPFPSNQSSPAKIHFVLPAEHISSKNVLLPIPQREMLYNSLAEQNAGY